ncbi:MAG: hypothetical protein ACXWNN_07290 [Candidatus Binataceae bacterium]
MILLKESIGTLSAFLAAEDEIQALDELAHSTRRLEDTPMLSHATKNRETHDAIERYVMAAIVDAREVYTDPNWLTWADHWINGRDRSFASARSAHRMARQACDRESVELAAEAQDSPEGVDTEFSLLETGAEMAAWAAGLALVTAPVAPDLTAGIRRIEFALRKRLAATRVAEGARSTRPSLAGRAVALARRAASMVMPSEVPQTVRL